MTQWRRRPQRAGWLLHFRSPFKTDAQRDGGQFVHACFLPMLVVCCWLATALAAYPVPVGAALRTAKNKRERKEKHALLSPETYRSFGKCTGPTCKMLFYPLLVQLERWDNSLRSARRLSHSEAQSSILCHWRNSERRNSNTKRTPKMQRIFEHQRRQE